MGSRHAKYLARSLEPVLRRAAREFPVLVLVGPRQSGKTTLLQHVFAKRHRYVSLEPPDVAAAAAEDPRAFLDAHPAPAILDEIQHAPQLLPYIKERVDRDRDVAGQYLLTGWQNLLLLERVTESLAGRAGVFRLLPLSRREASGQPDAPRGLRGPKNGGTEKCTVVDVQDEGLPTGIQSYARVLHLWDRA